MKYKSKRLKNAVKGLDVQKTYSVKDAITRLKEVPSTKFDQTFEVAFKLGVDPKKADQQVRGTVSLPHGTGKKVVVLVLAKGDKAKEAKEAGADFVGAEDLVEKIQEGWFEFTTMIVTPDMMRLVGKLGKILGPRGLMPTPKAGTVTMNVGKAVEEIKGGKIEYKVDKSGNIHTIFGKLSFSVDNLVENFKALSDAVAKSKPASVKGVYMKKLSIATTMGPGLRVEYNVG